MYLRGSVFIKAPQLMSDTMFVYTITILINMLNTCIVLCLHYVNISCFYKRLLTSGTRCDLYLTLRCLLIFKPV